MPETCSKENRKANGRWEKGHSGNPKGSNQFTSLAPLIAALEKAGKKRKQDFWTMVAARTWSNEHVLIAILKKILPDKVKGEGFANTNTVINILKTYAKHTGNTPGNENHRSPAVSQADSSV